jgi:orotate phosphoribosyltransferase
LREEVIDSARSDSRLTAFDDDTGEMMDWEAIFTKQQVIWKYPGHGPHAAYELWNKHSDFYFNSNYIICNPPLLKEATLALFNAVSAKLKARPKWVVTYPPFGLNVGFCLADLFQCKFAYIKSLDHSEIEFDIRPNDTVLFCADDLHTGGSFRKVISASIDAEATTVQPLAVVADFSGTAVFDGYEIVALIHENNRIWNADRCPLCANGSTALPARQNWQQLINEMNDDS